MIPGLNGEAEALLLSLLDPRATAISPASLAGHDFAVFTSADADLAAMGVFVSGSPDLIVTVTDPARAVGRLQVEAHGAGGLVFLDNREAGGQLFGNIRLLGAGATVFFAGLNDGYVALHDVFLRSDGQMLFWGAGATAVGASIEIEGESRCVVVGDDALLSSGIWIRNHDMHAIHDLQSGLRIDHEAVNTIIERHVWVGQNATLLGCQRVGAGAIVGAQSLAKGTIPGCTAVGGVPARILREGVSWGRSLKGMTDDERAGLGLPPAPA